MFGEPPFITNEIRSHQSQLTLIIVVIAILALLKMQLDFDSCLWELFLVGILFIGRMSADYSFVASYMIMSMFLMIKYFLDIATLFQYIYYFRSNPFSIKNNATKFYEIVVILSFIFGFYAQIKAFLAYKAFKYEVVKGFLGFDISTRGRGPARDDDDAPPRNHNHTPFQGRGIRIGD